jgi:transcriptional regulator with XRE-family HTH domain
MSERLPQIKENDSLPFTEMLETDLRIGFAKRFKELFRGLSNAEIARRLKTTDMVIKNYVDANRLPTFELQVRIYQATGANLHWLITGKGPQYDNTALELSAEQTIEIQHLAEKNGVKFQEQLSRLISGALDFLNKV